MHVCLQEHVCCNEGMLGQPAQSISTVLLCLLPAFWDIYARSRGVAAWGCRHPKGDARDDAVADHCGWPGMYSYGLRAVTLTAWAQELSAEQVAY